MIAFLRELDASEAMYGRELTGDEILRHAVKHYGKTKEQILSSCAKRELVAIRKAITWAMRDRNRSYPRIGQLLKKHHTTCKYHIGKVQAALSEGVSA